MRESYVPASKRVPNEILIVFMELACDAPSFTLSNAFVPGQFRSRRNSDLAKVLERDTLRPSESLPSPTSLALSLVSRRFNALVTPLMYRVVLIRIHESGKLGAFLKHIASRRDLRGLVRELRSDVHISPEALTMIATLCPNLEVFVPGNNSESLAYRIPSFPRLRALRLFQPHIKSLLFCMNQTEQRYLVFESRSQQEYRNVPPHINPPPRYPCLHSLILDTTWARNVGILIRFIEVHGRTSFPVLSELTIGQKIQDIAKVTQLVRVIGAHIPSLQTLSLGSIGCADTRETSLKMLDFLATARAMLVERGLNVICIYRVMPLGSEAFWKDVEASLMDVPSFEEEIPNFAAGWDRGPAVDGLRLLARGG